MNFQRETTVRQRRLKRRNQLTRLRRLGQNKSTTRAGCLNFCTLDISKVHKLRGQQASTTMTVKRFVTLQVCQRKLTVGKRPEKRKSIPDQNGPQTPGMNSLLRATAIWQVEVPQTSTIRWHMASLSFSEFFVLKTRSSTLAKSYRKSKANYTNITY